MKAQAEIQDSTKAFMACTHADLKNLNKPLLRQILPMSTDHQ